MQAPWWWSKTETCRSDIYVYFNVNFNVFFKFKNAFVGEWTLHIYQNARCNNKKTYIWCSFLCHLYHCSDLWMTALDGSVCIPCATRVCILTHEFHPYVHAKRAIRVTVCQCVNIDVAVHMFTYFHGSERYFNKTVTSLQQLTQIYMAFNLRNHLPGNKLSIWNCKSQQESKKLVSIN